MDFTETYLTSCTVSTFTIERIRVTNKQTNPWAKDRDLYTVQGDIPWSL